MKGLAFWFVFLGSLFALAGMAWGIQMSSSNNYALASAHAHSNLVGFVAMALYGIFYALAPAHADGKLAKIHFVLAAIGALLMGPGIAMAIMRQGEVVAILASIATILGMLCFAVNVWRSRTA